MYYIIRQKKGGALLISIEAFWKRKKNPFHDKAGFGANKYQLC